MTTAVLNKTTGSTAATARANALAERLEDGARALAAFANGLTEAEWQMRLPKDGRKLGVIVHHVASMYPLEMQLSQGIAAGTPMTGVIWDVVHGINASHARDFDAVTKPEALSLLARNSAEAAAGIRAFTDAQLDTAATLSFYEDAPLTCQFWLEDHPVRHSYHHLALIRAFLKK